MEEPHINSDPVLKDRVRRGNDLLARIDELTPDSKLESDGNGWRWLLRAAGNEIRRLRRELRDIASSIKRNEDVRKNGSW